MKRFSAAVLVMLAGFAAAGSLQAQNIDAMRVNVPFGFIVGSKQLPAGSYLISTGGSHIVVIQNQARAIGAMGITANVNPAQPGQHSMLFHKYGDRYFLSEIRCTSAAINGEFPPSKLEKKTQLLEASAQPETIQLELGN